MKTAVTREKALRFAGLGLLAALLIAGILLAIPNLSLPSHLWDIRGAVESVENDAQNGCVWVTIRENLQEDSHIRLRVTDKTSVKEYDGPVITADQLEPGDSIDADLKGALVDGSYYQAKRIQRTEKRG